MHREEELRAVRSHHQLEHGHVDQAAGAAAELEAEPLSILVPEVGSVTTAAEVDGDFKIIQRLIYSMKCEVISIIKNVSMTIEMVVKKITSFRSHLINC